MVNGIIIQCHDKSIRLPHKLFKELGDMTILEHVVATCCMSIADKVIIATSTDPANDTIIDLVKTFSDKYPKLSLYRYHGDDNDVLSRYYFASKEYKLDNIIRITSDCPLHSNHIIRLCIKIHTLNNNDYTSFSSVDGLDTEVFKFGALEDAYNNAKEPYQREHCTPYIKEKSSLKKEKLEDIKISLDTDEDLNRIRGIYEQGNKIRDSPGLLPKTQNV